MNKHMGSRLGRLKDGFGAGCQAVGDQASITSAHTARLVRREPGKALALAALMGLAVGVVSALVARSR